MARQSALGDMEKFAMNAVSILGAAAWAGLVTLVLGMQTALAEPLVYVPLGGEGKIVVVDAAKDEVVDTISGVTAVHGLAGTPEQIAQAKADDLVDPKDRGWTATGSYGMSG